MCATRRDSAVRGACCACLCVVILVSKFLDRVSAGRRAMRWDTTRTPRRLAAWHGGGLLEGNVGLEGN